MTIRKSRRSAATATETKRRAKSKSHPSSAVHTGSKAAAIIALLKVEGGATLEQVMEATGWQKHSIRGFMAGVLKKRHGLTAVSIKTGSGRSYRVEQEGAES